MDRLVELHQERNKKLNTPKTEQIDDLFNRALGIPKISAGWYWNNMPRERATRKLDDFVTLRGDVAHRGSSANKIHKADVTNYYSHVKLLVGKTGGRVHKTVTTATGKPLWSTRRSRGAS
jgi:HEPN superfamily RiboL-PSP-like protein